MGVRVAFDQPSAAQQFNRQIIVGHGCLATNSQPVDKVILFVPMPQRSPTVTAQSPDEI